MGRKVNRVSGENKNNKSQIVSHNTEIQSEIYKELNILEGKSNESKSKILAELKILKKNNE